MDQMTIRPQPSSPGAPDLSVESPAVSNNAPVIGENFDLSTTVTNQGDGESGPTTLRYYRSTDPTITTEDVPVGTMPVAPLTEVGSRSDTVPLTAPPDPGTYYYGACVEAVTGESKTNNNCSPAVEVMVLRTARQQSGQPNLQVGTPTVDDASPDTSAPFTLSATVSNTGDGEAPATTLRYYRSTDATITTSDTAVGTDAVGGLVASGSRGLSISLVAPSSAGTYYYGACVEAVTDESDTTDNCSSAVRVTVSVRHDLTVSVSFVNEQTPDTQTRFAVFIDVYNHGSVATPATTVRLYRSLGSWSGRSGMQVSSHPIGSLGPDGILRIPTSTRTPSDPGTYYFGACVDAVPGESDTTNNCSGAIEKTVSVTSDQASGVPDLVVETPKASNTTLGTEAAFTLRVTVRNTGLGESATTTLRYYRSTDATITTSDTAVGTAPIVALPPRGGRLPAITVTAPSSVGTYYYGGCVDAVADESDTANNCSSSVQVIVSVRQIDLAVSVSLVNEETAGQGRGVAILMQVDNNGNVATPTTTLRLYRSMGSWNGESGRQVASHPVAALAPGSKLRRITSTRTPSSPGTYYYGACVDALPDESDTTNNCSASVSLVVN